MREPREEQQPPVTPLLYLALVCCTAGPLTAETQEAAFFSGPFYRGTHRWLHVQTHKRHQQSLAWPTGCRTCPLHAQLAFSRAHPSQSWPGTPLSEEAQGLKCDSHRIPVFHCYANEPGWGLAKSGCGHQKRGQECASFPYTSLGQMGSGHTPLIKENASQMEWDEPSKVHQHTFWQVIFTCTFMFKRQICA